jgi:hypothetical protein
MDDIKELAIAYWRLQKWSKNPDIPKRIIVESALRSIQHYLNGMNIQVLDLTGRGYDPGLAVKIIYCEEDASLNTDSFIISEMISPIIYQSGKLLRTGEVVIKKHDVRSDDA